MIKNSLDKITETTYGNEDYRLMYDQVRKVRDTIAGEFFVKYRKREYLPHPSSINDNSREQNERYRKYIFGAEFDEFTDNTERVMISKMKVDDTEIELPESLSYLESDVDNDGLSIKELIESCAKNCLEVKYHIGLADYNGLTEVDIDKVSIDDLKAINPRATINQYPRESVLDWAFNRINGRMQLTYLLLMETGEEVDQEEMTHTTVRSLLKLGIDDTGYYQQKYSFDSDAGNLTKGEKNYVMVKGEALKFIPAEIIIDEEYTSGEMPLELGFLNSLSDLALARYRVSADYKEALSGLQPMVNVYGVNESAWQAFKIINGRDFISVGVSCPNIFKDADTKVEFAESNATLQPYMDYFEDNTKKVRALGGVFKTDIATQRTATEVINEAENQTAVLVPLSNSIESSIKKLVYYCGIFEGMYSQDNYDEIEDIDINLPRDFASSKITVEEAKEYREQYLSGLLPREEYFKVMEIGGWTVSTADELLTQTQEQNPIV